MNLTISTRGRRLQTAAILIIAASAMLFAMTAASWAQQGSSAKPRLLTPRSQGDGTVLELPVTPRQPTEPMNLRPLMPQAGQELEIPSRELRNQQGYAQVTVTVTDPSGRYVTGLNKDDFKIYENGQQHSIEFFRKDLNTPVSVGIVVDTSGSMVPKVPQARAAIAQFLNDLNERDDVFLLAFSDRPFMLQPFTTDHGLLRSRLGLLHAFGRTALYDVILQGLLYVAQGRYDKKALLVVTDGMDTASTGQLAQVIAQARRQGVLVYSIGIGDPGGSPSMAIAIGPFVFGGDSEKVDAETLRTLSSETGARTYIVREVGDGETLRQATEAISLELRQQYTVGYLSPNPERSGYRGIKVEVPTHPEAEVRVRKGITVGDRTASIDPAGSSP
jgi:Ca-activated chloride channel family protein